jgi:hypothetical protein
MEQIANETISLPWQLTVPSTSFVVSPLFESRPRRVCALSWKYEANSEFVKLPKEGIIRQELVFGGVAAFKCTFERLCGAELINLAYDAVVDLGETEWLAALRARSEGLLVRNIPLRHVAIFFDDGPCYEFICERVQVSQILI